MFIANTRIKVQQTALDECEGWRLLDIGLLKFEYPISENTLSFTAIRVRYTIIVRMSSITFLMTYPMTAKTMFEMNSIIRSPDKGLKPPILVISRPTIDQNWASAAKIESFKKTHPISVYQAPTKHTDQWSRARWITPRFVTPTASFPRMRYL